jgi:hypothetical protein
MWRDTYTMVGKYAAREEFMNMFKIDVSTEMKE